MNEDTYIIKTNSKTKKEEEEHIMFDALFNFIEETGMAIEETAYKVTHPDVWNCNNTSSSPRDPRLAGIEDLDEYVRMSHKLDEEDEKKKQEEEAKLAAMTKLKNGEEDIISSLKNVMDEKSYDSLIKMLMIANSPNTSTEEKTKALDDLQKVKISFSIADAMKMAGVDLEDIVKDDESNEPQSESKDSNDKGTASKPTTTSKTKTEPKSRASTKATTASKTKDKVNLKEAIEQTPLGGKLFEHVDPAPASN